MFDVSRSRPEWMRSINVRLGCDRQLSPSGGVFLRRRRDVRHDLSPRASNLATCAATRRRTCFAAFSPKRHLRNQRDSGFNPKSRRCMLPHFFVLHGFSASAVGTAHRYLAKGQSGRRLTVVEKVLCANHLNRTRCFRDDGAGNRSKDHAPHTAVTMRTQYD